MSERPITLTVTPAEYRMITTLRDMAESPLRDRVHRLLEDLLAFARNPRCSEFQADGAPCSNPAGRLRPVPDRHRHARHPQPGHPRGRPAGFSGKLS